MSIIPSSHLTHFKQYNSGNSSKHKTTASQAVQIILAMEESKFSWNLEMIVTVDRVKTWFSQRNQKNKSKNKHNCREKNKNNDKDIDKNNHKDNGRDKNNDKNKNPDKGRSKGKNAGAS